MNRRNYKEFTPKVATSYIYNNIFVKKLEAKIEIFEIAFLQANNQQLSLDDAIMSIISGWDKEALKTWSTDQLEAQFIQQWNTTYPQFLIQNLENFEASDDEASESSEDESGQEVMTFFKENGMPLEQEVVVILSQQYHSILRWLNEGKACVRWEFLNEGGKEKIRNRLLEGMCAVFLHLMTFHKIEKPEQLSACLHNSTIILHGSYLFGAENYEPKDMDVIIIGHVCSCTSASLPKMARKFAEDKMTIGHQCSILDVMVGIPICSTKMIDSYVDKEKLCSEAIGLLDGYLQSIPQERDSGKQYRKVVNCAVIIQYLLKLTGKEQDPALQNLIEQANKAIITGKKDAPEVTKEIWKACKQARKRLG